MTRDQINAMAVGRELDAAVAERVMEWAGVHVWKDDEMRSPDQLVGIMPGTRMTCTVPAYSANIEAAMAVLCKARGEPARPFTIQSEGRDRYWVLIVTSPTTSAAGTGATISEAIVRAALAAAVDG